MLLFSVLMPVANSFLLSCYLSMTLQTTVKYSFNLFFAISSPFEVPFPYSISNMFVVVLGYMFFPSLLALVIDQIVKANEDRTKLWMGAYRTAEKLYPDKESSELVKIADALVEKAKQFDNARSGTKIAGP